MVRFGKPLALLCLLGGLVTFSSMARAQTYFSARAVLAGFFPNSEKVSFETFSLSPAQRGRIKQRLGYAPARDSYTIFVARSGAKIDGYALIDEEKGQHQPITFATKLSAKAVVQDTQVMVYREARGDEIRDGRFLSQFRGKTARDQLKVSHDIDAISGATISCVSMATGVQRAAILVEELILGVSTVASASDRRQPAAQP